MIISDTAVRQRISVVVLAVIITLLGIYSYIVLPRESAPDVTIPHVFVSTNYKGVSSSDIETSITIPIEKKLKGLEGVKKVRSLSSEGVSSIDIEFLTGTDIDDALQKVRNKVDETKKDLPNDLEEDPSVFEVNISELPIVVFSLSGTCGNPCLKKLADALEDEIETVPGVLDVEVTGGLEREIRLEVSTDKLAYYGIPITALQHVVAGENLNTSGGSIRLGDGRFQLQVPGEFSSPEDLSGLVVGTHRGQPVYLKDMAVLVDGFKDETGRSRLDGREAVSIAVKKRAGENIITITERVDEIIQSHELGWPRGTRITKLMDHAKDIRLMVEDLENNILSGLVLVVGVLLFAMGLRNAIFVSLAIPLSMLITFTVLKTMGVTLNMVVLFSLTLALGMIVDNAIVVVENIYRHMQQGVPRLEAARQAAGEVAYPVIGSTLTTLAAFSPLLFWPGIMGDFMHYLPITLIVALASSLFVALVINPALASMFMEVGKSPHGLTAGEAASAGERPVRIRGLVLTFYVGLLRAALRRRIVVVLSSFAFLVILFQIWILTVGLEKPVEFFPDIDPKSIYVNIDAPEGAELEYVDRLVRELETRVYGPGAGSRLTAWGGEEFTGPSDLGNIEHIYAKAVSSARAGAFFERNSPNHLGIQLLDLKERRRPSWATAEEIRKRVREVPGGKITVAEAEEGPPTGAPINIEISGDDFRVLGGIAKAVREVVEQMPYLEDVRDDYVEGTPQVRVKVDRQLAALFGLSTKDIGFALKTGYKGLEVSTFRESGEDYDITVRLSDSRRRVVDVLRELLIPAPNGQIVPLTTLAEIDYTGGLGNITRINNERVVTVKASVDVTKIPGPVARAQAEQLLAGLSLPPGYGLKFTGELESQEEAEAFLSKAFATALFLIFLILVTQFNSVTQPFVIMASVVLSFGGAFLGLTLIGAPFGIIMSGVGVISLAGVVVNNGIVLIDYINKLRARGMALEEAVVAGGATRLRPVLLTAITTTLGLLPMVTGVSYDFHTWSLSWVSESGQWWRTMAIVVIFGLMTATFLTLVVVPTLYSLAFSARSGASTTAAAVRRLYWKPYEWLARRWD